MLFTILVSSAFAQSDSLQKVKIKKYSKVWNLSFEQGAMLGNGTEVGDQLAEASYYNGLDFRLGFRLNNYSDI